jgi:hypothetical protein
MKTSSHFGCMGLLSVDSTWQKWLIPLFHFRKIQYDISGGDEIEDNRAVYKRVVLTIAGPPFHLFLFDKELFINNTL